MRIPKYNFFKKKLIAKLFYVVFVFLFGIVGLFPTYSAGARVNTVYETLNVPGTSIAINVFGPNMIVAAIGEFFTKLVCGGETSIDTVFIKRTSLCSTMLGTDPLAKSQLIEKGIMPGGLAYYTASIAGGMIEEPTVPTNMALFIDDTFENNIFGIKPSYAQSGAFFGLSDLSKPRDTMFANITFDLWKQIRNLSLALTGVFLAIGAFGIMFRQKLSPQVVVSIGNVLPQIPIALVAIVLSYPIVTVFLNIVAPLSDIARSIAASATKPLLESANLGALLSAVYPGIKIISSSSDPYTILSAILSGIAGGFWIRGSAVSLFLFIASVVALIVVLITIIRFIYESGKVFITWVIITIMFPLVAAFSILPGKQVSLIFLLKKLIANVLVIPIMWFTFLVGMAIISTMFSSSARVGSSATIFDLMTSFIGADLVAPMMKFTLGIVFIWSGLGVRKHLENALGASGSVISILTPAPPQRR